MRKTALIAAILCAFAYAGASWAGSGCCPYSKGKKSADYAKSSCTKALDGITLTDEQKAEIAKIEEACKAEGMTPEACEKSMAKIRDVLNDDQKAQFDAATARSGKKSGCGS